jgi:tail protein
MSRADDLLAAAPTLEDWQISVGGLVLGPSTPYDLVDDTLTGLDELPGLRTSDEPRPWSHGMWDGDDWAEGRTVAWTVEVMAEAGVTLDDALDAYRAIMVPTSRTALVPLWVKLPRRPLMRWAVKVRRHRISTDQQYDLGLALAYAQLHASDPVGYGPGKTAVTGFAEAGSGLEYPLYTDGTTDVGYLDYGTAGSSGQVDLDNAGNAEMWPVFRVTGPTPADGFEIVDVPTGRRINYTGQVPSGSVVEIDSATGSVILDGVADRSGLVTVREWTAVPAEGSTTVGFVPLGPDGAATCTAIWADAWW